ncbi:MAG: crossover junction endodeoxyribonuclease RuvC [Candidatus Liptonbacteria bacterium]|nr:crossover junction endodeoxyribonuclease RuvC [Candidatus Liptonbacteria bacterium]
MKKIKILGVDPGANRIGFGAIERNKNKTSLLEYGVIEIKSSSIKNCTTGSRLIVLEKEISRLIKKIKPDIIGIERIYFARNQKTAMAVSEARGVIMLAIAKNKIPIKEYSPSTIKQRIAGHGKADKKDVLKIIKLLLKIKVFNSLDDASDALAIALVVDLDSEEITF